MTANDSAALTACVTFSYPSLVANCSLSPLVESQKKSDRPGQSPSGPFTAGPGAGEGELGMPSCVCVCVCVCVCMRARMNAEEGL